MNKPSKWFRVRRLLGGPGSRSSYLLGRVVVGLALVLTGLLVPYPGSIPSSWKHVDGNIVSVTAAIQSGKRSYYPDVQYLALGYTHEITAKKGLPYYPIIGASVPVRFDPDTPETARLVSEAPTNYFQLVLPLLGILLAAPAIFYLLLRLRNQLFTLRLAKKTLATSEPGQVDVESIEEPYVASEELVEEPDTEPVVASNAAEMPEETLLPPEPEAVSTEKNTPELTDPEPLEEPAPVLPVSIAEPVSTPEPAPMHAAPKRVIIPVSSSNDSSKVKPTKAKPKKKAIKKSGPNSRTLATRLKDPKKVAAKTPRKKVVQKSKPIKPKTKPKTK